MLTSQLEHQEMQLGSYLRDLPKKHRYHYTDEAARELKQILFRSLAGPNEQYLSLFFPHGPPQDAETPWSLRDAQGAVEGAEYTAAARGKPCGHIFRSGEATYRCKTCTHDDTVVLCSRCFDASDHEGHQVFVSITPGNSGCCDCGDEEAWVRPVNCNIHSLSAVPAGSKGKEKESSVLPQELTESIRMTISRALDYMLDVFSCSPEQLRLPKNEESILEDERTSRLTSSWYSPQDGEEEEKPEFALVLWNDEKHTVNDVRDVVARACKQKRAFGLAKANEVDDIGRSTIYYSSDIAQLLNMANIIEKIKLTVTIRSARDTFREQMAGTVVEWIGDIAGCSVGGDTQILRQTICEELLQSWRVGSPATHQGIGKDGIDDHQGDERDQQMADSLDAIIQLQALRRRRERRARREREERERLEGQGTANDETTGSDVDESEEGMAEDADSTGEGADDMDIDEFMDGDFDVDMEDTNADEALEVSEATLAGYPPPPPPPHGARAQTQTEESRSALSVPETPRNRYISSRPTRPPMYWLEKPDSYGKKAGIAPREDLWQRLRLDYIILYDLRLWKTLRIRIRDVLISTVVSIPEFKRLIGLRFAAVYTALAQLYLIADREPDHSIINLSLQMLTTPSITAEIVERGNFLTNLLAILYTFLTTRQVGYPWNIDPTATLAFDQGAVTNRRMWHFFQDMKYLLGSEHVQKRIREEDRYLLQFLDLVKLHQGICPNVRAVGEHIEYESEAWYSASLITREINKLCRQISEAFIWRRDEDPANLQRAIRSAARVATVNSMGAERARFDQSELKAETKFKELQVFEFDADPSTHDGPRYKVVDYEVAKEPMSFYHALHYTLSWLVDRGRSMPRNHLQALLTFSHPELQEYLPVNARLPECSPDEYLLALFDFPLRVCSWIAQMRANIWVRNGITLRTQMNQYKSVHQRDICYQRDIMLLQAALALCNPSVYQATMIDRFGLIGWMTGKYGPEQHGFEDTQALDVVEDFVHLLIIVLSDRAHLYPLEDEVEPQVAIMRRDIAHALIFKPLSYSEMTSRLSDRVHNAEEFNDILEEMTNFKAPEGISDSGTFALKEEYIELVDPYAHHYTRNQREEAETIYKNYMAKKTGKPAADIVFEPKLRTIPSGVFENLSDFTRTPLFTQVIYYLLGYALEAPKITPGIPATRIETYLQFVLQLLLVAILEDKSEQHEWSQSAPGSFATSVLTKRANVGLQGHETSRHDTILSILKALRENEDYKSCEPKISLIFHRLKQRQESTYIIASEALHLPADRLETASPASVTAQDKELKKKLALERQAKVMASFKEQQDKFKANQAFDWGEDISDFEDEEEMAAETEKTVKYPSGTCMLCQEETNDDTLFGTFGFVGESNLARTTNLRDDDWVDEVVQTPVNLDRSAEAIRPFGLASKNKHTVEKVSSTGERILTERQDLGKGFPTTQCKPAPVSNGCGHIMHYNCFEAYLTATERRHRNQIARAHPEHMAANEFMCPFCKALGNVFLPVIWKGKKVAYPGVLESASSFDDWIGSEVAVGISRLEKGPERSSGETSGAVTRLQQSLLDYGAREFTESVSSGIQQSLSLASRAAHAQVPLPRDLTPAAMELHLRAYNDETGEAGPPPSTPEAGSRSFAMPKLLEAYQRLRNTYSVNSIPSSFVYPHDSGASAQDLTHTDSLARTLGYSVAAAEIAQRGVESESWRGTLIDKISPQLMMHLRVFSETVSSYIAVGSLKSAGSTRTMDEYTDTQARQLRQLFVGHPDIFDPGVLAYDLKAIAPMLSQDPFVFLTELSVCLVPAHNLDIHHVLRLCYLAEMVRVVLALMNLSGGLLNDSPGSPHPNRFQNPSQFINAEKCAHGTFTNEQLVNIFNFIAFCVANTENGPLSHDVGAAMAAMPEHTKDPQFLYFVFTMASTYALAFVRKAALLMHVRYGIELPHVPHNAVDEPELTRLSTLLRLPSLHEIFASFGAATPGANATRYIIAGWVRHWMWAREGKRVSSSSSPTSSTSSISISLSHPAIYELVGLPRTYDTLTDEAIRRRCPTTGKDVVDPCLCLFCGEIFCGQAVCCMVYGDGGTGGADGRRTEPRGGCNQHQLKCSGPIGLFINIRKCMVLFLHKGHGTFAVAPYLDKHGEVDPTLRRNHQLFLNQKRYDVLLRKVWLEGGMQSLIARRLEADINTGGWETL